MDILFGCISIKMTPLGPERQNTFCWLEKKNLKMYIMRHIEVSTIFNSESRYAQLFTYSCILASILLIPIDFM